MYGLRPNNGKDNGVIDEKDPPIEGLNYRGGVTVVDIGDHRVTRGMSRRPHSLCRHTNLHYDKQERRVWCPDCETDIEAFDAFLTLVESYDAALKEVTAKGKRLEEAEKFQLRTLAAKAIDEAWRSRKMVPACPHCKHGLFPEDFKNGIAAKLDKGYAIALRDGKG